MKTPALINYTFLFFAMSLQACTISPADDACQVSGKVVNSSGVSLAEVSIKVVCGKQSLQTISAQNGTYRVEIADAGPLELTFSKKDYLVQKTNMVLLGGDKKTANITLLQVTE